MQDKSLDQGRSVMGGEIDLKNYTMQLDRCVMRGHVFTSGELVDSGGQVCNKRSSLTLHKLLDLVEQVLNEK